MNIFVIDPSTSVCAQALDDLRLNKMIVETAQILSTALRVNGYTGDDIYKETHVNHPCAVWARESIENYMWLFEYLENLLKERFNRIGKQHKTQNILNTLIWNCYTIPQRPMTQFVNCSTYKDKEVFEAYKLTLIDKWNNDKRPPTWTNTKKPDWYINE